MNHREYLDQWSKLRTAPLLELLDWAEHDARPWVRSEVDGVLGKPAGSINPTEAIRAGLPTSYHDLIMMPQNGRFYVAHLAMFESELDRFIRSGRGFLNKQSPPYPHATEHELREGLQDLLFAAPVLLEAAGAIRLDLPGAYGAYSAGSDHTFPVFKAAEQMIYGRYSGLTHTDRAPFAPVPILRTALELRIRRAFGIQSFLNPNNYATKPIQVGDLFDVILQFERQIDASVDLHDVRRVYKWSNPYLHAGRRDFVWTAGFALQFLRPLFVGPETLKSRGGWSIHGGLEMPRVVWEKVRRHFEKIAVKKKLILLPVHPTPECVLF